MGRDWEESLPSNELKMELRSGARNASCCSEINGLLGIFEAGHTSVNQWV